MADRLQSAAETVSSYLRAVGCRRNPRSTREAEQGVHQDAGNNTYIFAPIANTRGRSHLRTIESALFNHPKHWKLFQDHSEIFWGALVLKSASLRDAAGVSMRLDATMVVYSWSSRLGTSLAPAQQRHLSDCGMRSHLFLIRRSAGGDSLDLDPNRGVFPIPPQVASTISMAYLRVTRDEYIHACEYGVFPAGTIFALSRADYPPFRCSTGMGRCLSGGVKMTALRYASTLAILRSPR